MGDPSIQRVKVYRLNEEGLWDDKGTGHVSVEVMEVSKQLTISYCTAASRRRRHATPGTSWHCRLPPPAALQGSSAASNLVLNWMCFLATPTT